MPLRSPLKQAIPLDAPYDLHTKMGSTCQLISNLSECTPLQDLLHPCSWSANRK